MFTNPLADAIKRAVGARKPTVRTDPFVPVIAEVWTEHSSMVSRLPEQFTIYLPVREVFVSD